MAMSLQRARTELVGQGEGLTVVGCGLLARRRSAMRRDLAEKAQGIGLVAPLLALTGER